jgi:hypothetical protein
VLRSTFLLTIDTFMAERDSFTFTFARVMNITKHAASVAEAKFLMSVSF